MKLYLVDGSAFIFRAYYALPDMYRKDGVQVNAVYGFTKMMLSVKEELCQDDLIAVVMDHKDKSFRNQIYDKYKANRKAPPEDLIPQFELIDKAISALSLRMLRKKGFEADDIIASYTKQAEEDGVEVVVVSSDKDLMQLVSKNVCMYDPMKKKMIKEQEVHEKFGVIPSKVVDVQALTGDSSDNIPGVKSVGPKTAATLIDEYGSLEGVYENIENISKKKLKENLITYKDDAFLSYKLASLSCEALLESVDYKDLVNSSLCENTFADFLLENNFNSMYKSFVKKCNSLNLDIEATAVFKKETHQEAEKGGKIAISEVDGRKGSYKLIENNDDFNILIERLENSFIFSFDLETDSLDEINANIVGISLALSCYEAYYIPLKNHKDFEVSLDENKVLQSLKKYLEDKKILKVAHNSKYDILVLKKYNVSVVSYDDIMLMSYVINSTKISHSLDSLANHYLSYKTIKFEDVVAKKQTFQDVEIVKATEYAAEDADITLRLYCLLKNMLLASKAKYIYEKYDKPLVDVLLSMENEGILVDKNYLQDLSVIFKSKINELTEDIFKKTGCEFNLSSPKQLGEVLFEKLSFKGSKNKNGSWKTDVLSLEKIEDEETGLIKQILYWRQINKLKTTYTDALISAINPKTERVHTSYLQFIVNTGRLSSQNPNLQNIPVKTEEGRKIRQAFKAKDGFVLLSADYSQVELRVLAYYAGVDNLIKAFNEGKDIHKITASEVFEISLEDVTNEHRSKAKMINFGIVYGISPYGLAKRLNISADEAKAYISSYFKKYPKIAEYMENTKSFARDNGYVCTMSGRMCHIENIKSSNGALRSFAERVAINAPIQGSAADIMKLAMINVQNAINKQGLKSKILLQIHDEIVLEVLPQELEQIKALLRQEMTHLDGIDINLDVDINTGYKWSDIK